MRRRIALIIAAAAIAAASIWAGSGMTAQAKVSPKTSPTPGGRVIHQYK